MDENKTVLNDHVSNNTLGIVWLTDSKLSDKLKYFHEINYLLNGLLVTNAANSEGKQNSFYMTEGFGHPFFMGHIQSSSNSMDNDIESIVNLLKPHHFENANIVLINESAQNDNVNIGKLKKEFSLFQFIELK